MVEPTIQPDWPGLVDDLNARAARWAPVYTAPDLKDVVAMLHRNPAAASIVRPAVEAAIAQLPNPVPLSEPVFDASGKVSLRVAAGLPLAEGA